MSEYECTEHLLDEIERLREANFELREGELRQRIKQLEAVVNDPHALWANWLRGDVKLPAGIGDVRQYQDRIKRLEEGILKDNQEIEQTCGKVLGYPWFKDDQKNFPGATEKDGVCVGDHVAETIVSELAKRHTEALTRIKWLEEAGDAMAEWLENPRNLGADATLSHAWREAKEAKP